MPLPDDIWEMPTSGATDQSYVDGSRKTTLDYQTSGYDTADEVEAAILAESPATIGAMKRRAVSLTPQSTDVWTGAVAYESTPPDGWSFSGQTTGGSTKITQGLATTKYGASAVDYAGAINVSPNGVEGVDIVIPALEFSITKNQASGVVTLSFVATLVSMSGTTNNATFNGFAAGELLFLGAEFSQQSTGEVSVTYKFSASPNQSGLTIGTITGVAKKGHEYMWVDYEATEDATTGCVSRKPRGVYVHRVYRETNFASLGI